MDSRIAAVKEYVERAVKTRSIYVWGAKGQLGTGITEAWIRQKEASCTTKRDSKGRLYADLAVSMWVARMAQGNTTFRVYDCSGLVSAALIVAGLLDKRRDCDALWSKCSRISAVRDGCLLFRVNSKNSEDETHVGLYFAGYQYHAKGREDGVVKEPYKASDWHKIGWLKSLPQTATSVVPVTPAHASEADDITPPYVEVINGTVYIREKPLSAPVGSAERDKEKAAVKKLCTVSKGMRLPYIETDADTGWFAVQCAKGDGFITGDEHYTKLVTT